MRSVSLDDVFTADEVARAAQVPQDVVLRLARGAGAAAGSGFFTAAEAIHLGRHARALLAASPTLAPASFFDGSSRFRPRDTRLPAFASTCVHTLLVGVVLWLAAGPTQSASSEGPRDEARLVFLVTPGPGGGGGGGGSRSPKPAPRLERQGASRRTPVPLTAIQPVVTTRRQAEEPPRPATVPLDPPPVQPVTEPAPAPAVVAPVAAAAASAREREGVIEDPRGDADARGAGTGAGAGNGQGAGNGDGLGAGLGDGSGGGTGGGPYRPGSGIQPPRLLREVKAQYTDEARRRNLSGDVLLEIVVTRDGSVGDVRVLQGLGGGLDQRAVAAVRQWRFAPAQRRGEPVDVLVEVAVEFTLR